MIRWLLFSIFSLVILTVLDVNSIGNMRNPGASDAENSMLEQPSVYFSTTPNLCANFSGLEYWIFVNSPAADNLNGVSFDLDVTGTAPLPLVIPESGVTLGMIDVSEFPYHFEATWTSHSLEHEPIIKLIYSTEPALGEISPYNVVFGSTGGGSVTGYGLSTITCCVDCFVCFFDFFAPDHAFAPVGKTTFIQFEWSWYCWFQGGSDITVTDTEGWVVSWAPESVWDDPNCGFCIIPRYDGWIEVFVPEEVPVGTTSQLTITGENSSTELILEADDVIPVENTTWGKIKKLYH